VTTELIADTAGERLDQFVARSLPSLTRTHAQRLIDDGRVLVAGARAKASLRLEAGVSVSVDVPAPKAATATPQPIALDIIYEDEHIIAVNKPPGMAVHPSPGHEHSTLVNAILAHCDDLSGIGGALRPGIVHRLDRDTSGVILIARNDDAHRGLVRQLKDRTIEKTYVALVTGVPSPAEGIIDAPIARHGRQRQRMAIVAGGREATTAYRVIERFDEVSLVEARPKTGRTHQIRVHLAAIGHPIVGDVLYGKRSPIVGRQFLHAARIAFVHPRSGESMVLDAALAPDLEEALAVLRAGNSRAR
jgi:23S rRNA pseudouridine1911/1915/1917 synthase